jgi:hypothetical protein
MKKTVTMISALVFILTFVSASYAQTLETTWYLKFGNQYSTSITNYNNLFPTAFPLASGTAYNNLKKDDGSATTINFVTTSALSGAGNTATCTGNPQPDSWWRVENSETFSAKFTGLNTAKTYKLTFYHNSGSNAATAIYTINGTSQTLNGQNNCTNTVNFAAISPNASGEISFTLSRNTGYYQAGMSLLKLEQFSSTGGSDTQAPTVPAGLASSNITSTGFTLSWTASTDNVGVTGYDVYQNSILIASPATNSYAVSGLTASTTYSFTVRAKDAAGNNSSQSSALSVTTSASGGGGTTNLWSVSGNDIYNTNTGNVGIGTSGPESKLHISSGGLRHGYPGAIGIDASGIIGGRFTILDNGNVGINNNNPQHKLHVNGNIDAQSFTINGQPFTGSGSGGGSQWITTGNNIYYSTGNVGIGNNSPTEKLEINGNIKLPATNQILFGSDFATIRTATVDNKRLLLLNAGVGSKGQIAIEGNDDFSCYGQTFLMDNVGIGTGTPTRKLELTNGNAWFRAGNTGSLATVLELGTLVGSVGEIYPAFNVTSQDEGGYNYLKYNSARNGTNYTWSHASENGERKMVQFLQDVAGHYVQVFGNTNVASIQLHSNGNSFFNGGNVGIGITNPTTKLQVAGTIDAQGFTVNGQPFTGSSSSLWQSNGNTVFYNSGSIGIGTNNTNNMKLAVEGIIGARGVRVLTPGTAWPDYVFDNRYKLRPLSEVEQYIRLYKHLPEVPSATEIEKQGIDVAQMDAKLLQKIEEITLYLIQSQKETQAIRKTNELLTGK